MRNIQPTNLNVYQKRQATLLYHYSSIEHLDVIIERVRALTAITDASIDFASRLERDKAMREVGWEHGHPNPNHFEYGMPRLNDCLKALLEDRRLRAQDWFDISGVSGTLIGIDHFPVYWDSAEEETTYREMSGEALSPARCLDSTVQRRWTDYDLTWHWNDFKQTHPKMPRLRVRTDIEGETGKPPPRTGVYVPQDDPFGTLQFAWTGSADGALQDCETLSELAREYMALVGRDRLWRAPNSLMTLTNWGEYTTQYFDSWCRSVKKMAFPYSIAARNKRACATRPCKWYFVERIDGEFEEDEPAEDAQASAEKLDILFAVSDPRFPAETPAQGRLWPGIVILLMLLGLLGLLCSVVVDALTR